MLSTVPFVYPYKYILSSEQVFLLDHHFMEIRTVSSMRFLPHPFFINIFHSCSRAEPPPPPKCLYGYFFLGLCQMPLALLSEILLPSVLSDSVFMACSTASAKGHLSSASVSLW